MDPEMFEDDIIRAGMFEDECEAQDSAAAEKIQNDQQHHDEGFNPDHDMYHDRYDDDPYPYHGTYSEE